MRYLAIVLGLLFAVQVFSQNINDTIELKEVVINDSTVGRQTYKVNVNDKLEVNTGEMLNSIPGISVLKRGVFSAEPMIRTFKYDQVNTIIDGGVKASSSCPNRMDPLTARIAPNDVGWVEVVKGPYNVRNGQVLGGTVNLHTGNPVFNTSSHIGGKAGVSYNSNGNGVALFGGVNQSSSKIYNSIGADFRKANNYTSGDGTEIASEYQNFGFNYKGGLKIANNQVLILNASYAQANDVLHAGLPMDADYDKSTILSANYSIYSISKVVEKAELQFYYAMEDHQMSNAKRPNAMASLATTPVESNDIGGKLEFTLKPFNKARLYLGTDYWQVAKDGQKNVTVYQNVCTGMVFDPPMQTTSKVWQDSYQNTWGLFGQMQFDFSSKFTGTIGIRSNYNTTGINDPAENFKAYYGDSLNVDNEMLMNYFVTLEYQVNPQFSVAIKAGQGTRSPDLLERYINHFTVGLDMYEYVGNPTLESEKNKQIDLILTKKGESFTAYFDVFYSQVDNYISAAEDTTIPRMYMPCKDPKFAKRFINIDEAQLYGGELGFSVLFARYFQVNSGVQYNYAQNKDWDEPLPEIPPLSINGALLFSYKKLSSVFDFDYQAKQDRIAVSFGEKESPAFFVANLMVNYQLIDGLDVGVELSNLFNENYYQHLSRPYKNMDTSSPFFEPGRSFKVMLSYVF